MAIITLLTYQNLFPKPVKTTISLPAVKYILGASYIRKLNKNELSNAIVNILKNDYKIEYETIKLKNLGINTNQYVYKIKTKDLLNSLYQYKNQNIKLLKEYLNNNSNELIKLSKLYEMLQSHYLHFFNIPFLFSLQNSIIKDYYLLEHNVINTSELYISEIWNYAF